MFSNIIQFITTAINGVWNWFDTLFNSINGAWEFIFVVIVIYLVTKHLIMPLVGGVIQSARSDQVKAIRGKGNKGKYNG